MRRSIMKKGSLSLSQPPPPLLLFVILLSLFGECFSEEFFCHYGGGLQFTGDKREIGAIIPRGDINVKVGEDNEKVYCRFNSTFINSEDVYFSTRNTILPSRIVNETTILTEIAHSGPDKYELFCKLKKKKKGDKTLCSQIVKAGYPPLDVKNFSCISENNINLNCSWTKPQNPILTTYYSNYTIPNYKGITPCPESNVPSATYCFWNKSNRIPLLRPEFDLTITGINEFGTRNYTYRIYIPKIVVPEKISAEVSLIGPVRVKVSWNLTYPMDVFHYGLWHSVEYRVKDESQWENVTFFFHKKNLLTLNPNRTFSVEVSLPFSDAEYEFRVRIHTGIGEIREDMWSGFDILTVKTEPLAPRVAPETSMSSFEVEEGLEKRNIFVNFKDFNDTRLEGGKDFHYIASVYSLDDAKEIDVSPVEVTRAYIKYKNMNFTEYNFRIIPANEMGSGNVFSEVTVPNSDCMPKKTGMLTVITSTSYQGKMFSLYWVPSRMPNGHCEGLSIDIESYTIFWCKRTSGNRCKEKMDWMEIKTEDLSVKDLSSLTSADIVIFEKNVTHLRDDKLYSFGVAANSGNYSSGIRWSSCIVDDTEQPLPPVTEVEALTNDSGTVLVKWNLKCMSISSVPVGFNISYCKSTVEDFGHCTSEVHFEEMNSPTSSEVLISGLDAGNSYIFSVSVLSIIGEGIQSYPKIIKLREDIPAGPPKDLKAVLVTNSTVELRWNPPTKLERRGIVTHYKISVVPPVRENIVVKSVSEEDAVTYTLKDLHPFTKYKIFISSCNTKGCSVSNQAELSFDTEPGVPDNVENFNLDVSNWRLMWDLKHCNSRFCSFDIQLPVNETVNKTVTVDDKETLSLHEENIMCNYTKMKFGVRAKGQDKEGNFLYGNWTYASKDASDCPSGSVFVLSQKLDALVVVPIFYQVQRGNLGDGDFYERGKISPRLIDLRPRDGNQHLEGKSIGNKAINTISKRISERIQSPFDGESSSFVPIKIKPSPQIIIPNHTSNEGQKFNDSMAGFRVSVKPFKSEYNIESNPVTGLNGSRNVSESVKLFSMGQSNKRNSSLSQAFRPSKPLFYHLGSFQFNGGVYRNNLMPEDNVPNTEVGGSEDTQRMMEFNDQNLKSDKIYPKLLRPIAQHLRNEKLLLEKTSEDAMSDTQHPSSLQNFLKIVVNSAGKEIFSNKSKNIETFFNYGTIINNSSNLLTKNLTNSLEETFDNNGIETNYKTQCTDPNNSNCQQGNDLTKHLEPLQLIILSGSNKLNLTLNENFELSVKRKWNGDVNLQLTRNEIETNHLDAEEINPATTEEMKTDLSILLDKLLKLVT